MAQPFVVSIPHSLAKLRRLKTGIPRMMGNIQFVKIESEGWVADQMSFRVRALGQVSTGTIDVAEYTVRLELSLPLILRNFAAAIQGALTHGARHLLEKK